MSEALPPRIGLGFIPPNIACWAALQPPPPSPSLRPRHYSGQVHEEAAAKGEGCAVLDGSLVERLHAENARRVIELHESIAALEAGQESGV